MMSYRTPADAVKEAMAIRRSILKAIKDYDSQELLRLIDILDFESADLIRDLPTWTSDRGESWRDRLKKWRDEARDAFECF